MLKIIKKEYIEHTQQAMLVDGYERLRFAIVEQAIEDYKRALKLKAKGKYQIFKLSGYQFIITAEYLEKWFLSSYGQMLSGGNGEMIIEQCKIAVEKEQKK